MLYPLFVYRLRISYFLRRRQRLGSGVFERCTVEGPGRYEGLALLLPSAASHRFLILCVDSKPWSIPGFLKLVYSLPLLEDLDLADYAMDGDDDDYDNDDDDSTALQPLTPPPLTGTLVLSLIQGMGPVTRRLLELPNGIHFRKLQCMWHLREEELWWIMDVVEGCSDTLECISIYSEFNARGKFLPISFPYGAVTGFLSRTSDMGSKFNRLL